jgi:uncharacterized membrane protein
MGKSAKLRMWTQQAGESKMTELQIERAVERATDRLDERYMSGEISRAKYADEMDKLSAWAEREYRRVVR